MHSKTLGGFRLSPQQKRLWLLQQDSAAYCALLLEGNLKVDVLKTALEQVVNQHEILRTTFHRLPGMKIPVMVVADSSVPLWQEIDLSDQEPQQQEAKITALFQEAKRANFDLEQVSLHLSLLKLSAEKYILLISLPALCADSWTLQKLVEKISLAYAGDFSTEEVQYVQFSEWQHQLLEEEDATGKEYWEQQDFSSLDRIKLPFERNLKTSEFAIDCVSLTLDSKAVAKLEKSDIALDICLLASWQVLLWRLTGEENIVGAAVDGREFETLHSVLGLCTKWLPIKSCLAVKLRFQEVLELVSQALREASEWQEYFVWEPFDGVTSKAQFAVGFEFEQSVLKRFGAGVSFSLLNFYSCIERFKIKLVCTREKADFYYDSNLFSAETIQRLVKQFQTLFASATENPEVAISRLEILQPSDRAQLLAHNNTQTDYPEQQCIHHLFEAQSAQTPDNIAVVFEDQQLTYRELNARANKIAHHLQMLGVKPEVVVGLCLERSLDMVVGMLGILKAGGAYLPLDPALPQERLDFMSQVAQIVLTKRRFCGKSYEGKTTVCLDEDWEAAQQSNANPTSEANSKNLVYVLFTSGSTGKPKPVAIEHQQLLNYLRAILDKLNLPTGASFALVSTFAADLGNTVIFPALCTGGCLHIVSAERATDSAALADYFGRYPIDCLKIVPSHLAALLASSHSAQILPQRLVLGGEALSWQLIEQIQQHKPECQILNHYGPTEATVGVLTYQVDKADRPDSETVPLGRPLANTQVYVLDRHLQLVPVGVSGELYIGGAGLARGYLNREDLTALRFISNPFSDTEARLYKTGDLVRYLPDGNLEFLGRTDDQVKIRGFRIELGEIETLLSQDPSVRQVVILAREDQPGDRRLVAYVVPHPGQVTNTNDLRHFLQQKLPEYMVPSVVILKALPLTANGKVDRGALPVPDQIRPELGDFVAPGTSTEQAIAKIWAEVLGIEQVGIHDNFFELGGHSLLATLVISKLRQAFQVELPLRDFFEMPTIAGVAKKIEEAKDKGAYLNEPEIVAVSRTAHRVKLSSLKDGDPLTL
ncbi:MULTISPECIES: non-ribosomal peptide synthetase [Cyanophyceae]|uniref:non-ribosomal peptide synthetase n=1 Tax=Cyanophyceae TaxID=3028117 RepID=UPI0016871BDA|nr:non-ribosomal peptide synthetase [Trichocoleus sp. FACHB-40]MBD2002952.1 amino acid adenylation domain-containing protein [Trichocoleus sp. FACHB-40]